MSGRIRIVGRDGYISIPDEFMGRRNSRPLTIQSLINKIDEICMTCIDPVLYEAENMFRSLATNQESMREVMMNLHCKALSDMKFGEKYVLVLGQVSNFIVDNVLVRSEILNFIENDYKIKDTMYQSDNAKFMNAVMLLGNVYNTVKIQGVPLEVLAAPMMEYLRILLEGREDHHRVLTVQLLLNGRKILRARNMSAKLATLQENIRRALITRNLNSKSKCWLMLALETMLNGMRPLAEDLKDFYLGNLGEDNVHVYSLMKEPYGVACSIDPDYPPPTLRGDIFKDIDELPISDEVLRAMTNRGGRRPGSFLGLCVGAGTRAKEEFDIVRARPMENVERDTPPNFDEGDLYGIQLERNDDAQREFGEEN